MTTAHCSFFFLCCGGDGEAVAMAARGLTDAGAAPAEYVCSCVSVERTNRRASVCLLARVWVYSI